MSEESTIPTYHTKDFNELIGYIEMLCQVIVVQHEQIQTLNKAHSQLSTIITMTEYMRPVFDFLRDCRRDE